MSTTRTIQLDVDTKSAVKSVKDLESELSNLAGETIELTQINQEFKQELLDLEIQFDKIPKTALSARKQIGGQIENLKNAIKENNLALEGFKIKKQQKNKLIKDLKDVESVSKSTGQKIGAALGGATSGFAAVQGAMGLVGSESEALEETLLKVNSAIALQQGVKGVLDYTKSIGLAGKATKVFNLIVKANPLALLATTLIAIIGYFAVFTDAIDIAINKLKSITDFIGLTDFAEQELEEKRKKRDEVALSRFKRIQDAAKKAQEEGKERAAEEKLRLEKQAEAYREYVADRLAAARQIQDLEIQLMEDGIKKELKENEVKFQRLRENAKANTDLTESEKIKKIKLFGQLENQARLEIIQNNVDQATDAQLQEIQVLDEHGQMKIEKLQLQAKGEVDVEKQKNAIILQDNRKTDEEIAESKRQALDMHLTAASTVFSKIGDIANMLAGEDKERAKKAFNINKGVAIAQATISTAQGIMSELSHPVKTLTFTNYAAAAAMAAAGAIQIGTIAKTKFDDGGGGNDVTTPTESGGGAQAPSFNVVGDSSLNQLASLQQQPMQAFVVSGEVTTAQALDRNRIQNATL